jgi:hypothetical protein
MKFRSVMLVGVWIVCAAARALGQTTYYADANAAPGGDGRSWASAFQSVQQALNAMHNRDTLLTRGTFHETVSFPPSLNYVTWLGSTDPDRPTWMRGDITLPLSSWQVSWQSAEVVAAMVPAEMPGFPGGRPGGAVYDYKRDDAEGTVTGIPVIRPWYGHLIPATSLNQCIETDGSWWYDPASKATFVNPPGPLAAADLSLIGLCVYDRNAVTLPANHHVRISGVNTMLTPSRVDNNGYGFKGSGQNNTIEHCTIVDSGWHAAGFAMNDSYRNTLRELTAYGSSVPASVNTANPFVFYSAVTRRESGNRGDTLTYFAYPILRFDGAPLFNDFNPRLGLSHSTTWTTLGGIEWRRCLQIDYVNELRAKHGVEMEWSGGFISASNMPVTPNPNPNHDADLASIRVYDSVVIGPSAKPNHGIAYFNTVFDRRGHPQEETGTIRASGNLWLVGCVLDPGLLREPDACYFRNLNSATRYFLDACTIVITDPESTSGYLFSINQHCQMLSMRSCLVWRATPGPLIVSQPASWQMLPQIITPGVSAFAGVAQPVAHSNPAVSPRTAAWWQASIDPAARFDLVPKFQDIDALDLRPEPGSPIATTFATPIVNDLLHREVGGVLYAGRFGQAQVVADLDVDHDGLRTIEDVYAAHHAAAAPEIWAIRRLIATRLRDGEQADVGR